MIDGESKGGDCDEVICAGWGEPGGEWTPQGRSPRLQELS